MSELVYTSPTVFSFVQVEQILRLIQTDAGAAQFSADLSALESASITSLAGLTTISERLSRNGGRVFATLPDAFPRPSEVASLERSARDGDSAHHAMLTGVTDAARRRRGAARMNLETAGMMDLMQETSPNQPRIYNPRPHDSLIATVRTALDSSANTTSGPSTLPLTWMNPDQADVFLQSWFDEITAIIARGHRYFSATLADNIARVVYQELVQNVIDHAGHGLDEDAIVNALVGARIEAQGSPTVALGLGSLFPSFEEYTHWLHSNSIPNATLVVADAGASIPRTILESYRATTSAKRTQYGTSVEDQACLEFALSPLGTRRSREASKRGARGLSRLLALARENEGALFVRSGRAAIGQAFPERTRLTFARNKLPPLHGTIVEVILPALRRSSHHFARRTNTMTRLSTQIVPIKTSEAEHLASMVSQHEIAGGRFGLTILQLTDTDRPSESSFMALVNEVATIASVFEASRLVTLWLPRESSRSASHIMHVIDDAVEQGDPATLRGVGITSDPGVFLSVFGDGTWSFHGGRSRARALLYAASENQGVCPAPDDPGLGEILRTRSAGAAWLIADDYSKRLAITPDAVQRVIDELSTAAIREALEHRVVP